MEPPGGVFGVVGSDDVLRGMGGGGPPEPVRRCVGLGALPRVARTCARGVEQQIPVKRRGLGAAHRADDVDDGRPPLDVEARRGGEGAQRAERRVVAVRAQVLARVALLCAAQVDVTADGVAPPGVAAEQQQRERILFFNDGEPCN